MEVDLARRRGGDASPVDPHAEIYLVSDVDTDTPAFQPRGDALFNVSDDVLQGAENDITSLAVWKSKFTARSC